MSTRNPTHGTKVKDSSAPQIEEGSGAIASDSLAADSTRAGGEFGENRGSEPLGVAGANSTFANTNTSGAKTLEPAADSEIRNSATENSDDSYPSGTGGQSKSTAITDTTGSHETGGTTSSAGVAPTYVNSQAGPVGGPKGKNLTEGGFDSDDSKNASFTSDIGDKNDPGLAAEEKFSRENAENSGDSAPRQRGGDGEGLYDALGDTSA